MDESRDDMGTLEITVKGLNVDSFQIKGCALVVVRSKHVCWDGRGEIAPEFFLVRAEYHLAKSLRRDYSSYWFMTSTRRFACA